MIDLLIVALLLIGVIVGFKKGMVEKLWGIFSSVFSYGLALLYHSELADEIVKILPKYIPISSTFLNGTIFDVISRVLAFFLLSLVIKLVLKVVILVLEGIFSLPLLSGVNKIVGAAIGLLEMYFILFLLFAFLSFFPQQEIQKYLGKSEIAQTMLNETPFISIPYQKMYQGITNPS